MISVLAFFLVLSVLVLVHELGHFYIAKRSGIWVEEFGFGIPPRIYGKKFGETLYSINLLPFGGFVRLHGEQTEDGVTKPERAFLNKSKKVRILVVVAGVVMNALLAVVCFAFVYSVTGIPRETDKVIVVGVSEGSPAYFAGVKSDDVIVKVNGEMVGNSDDFISLMEGNKGREVTLSLLEKSSGGVIDKSMVPRIDPPEGEGPIGVAISNVEIYFPPIWVRPFYGVYFGFREALGWGGLILGGLGNMLTNLFTGNISKDITGPVGVYALTSQAVKLGWISFINFLGIFSLNLAIINILPFPALDGGRLFFVVLEGIIGKKVKPKYEAIVHTLGMALLLALIFAITFNDIKRLITAGSISKFLEMAVK